MLRPQIGLWAAVALLALRLGVGWHFFTQGAEKVHDPHFSSAGFLSAAKGPLAPLYHNMAGDTDGRMRLDLDATLDRWALYREKLSLHYGFDAEQQASAGAIFDRYQGYLTDHFDSNQQEIEKYLNGLDRLDTAHANAALRDVPSLKQQVTKTESDVRSQGAPLLASIDQMWADYERELNALATDEQRANGTPALQRPGSRGPINSKYVDVVLPWFDLTIGGLLIVGLLTRVASGAGALFLIAVMSTQWPGTPGAVPIDYQLIETLALLALMATGAGRFGGLDFFGASLCSWCCPRKKETRP